MTKLTNAQAALLTEAAKSDDGAIVAADAAKATIVGLIRRGLVISLPQAEGPPRLIITEAGRAAVKPPEDEGEPSTAPASEASAEPASAEPEVPPPETKRRTKIQAVIALLRRAEGASVEEIMTATGWQAHSVRGAMSGAIKKGLGLEVVSEKTEAGRRYRILASEAAA